MPATIRDMPLLQKDVMVCFTTYSHGTEGDQQPGTLRVYTTCGHNIYKTYSPKITMCPVLNTVCN